MPKYYNSTIVDKYQLARFGLIEILRSKKTMDLSPTFDPRKIPLIVTSFFASC